MEKYTMTKLVVGIGSTLVAVEVVAFVIIFGGF